MKRSLAMAALCLTAAACVPHSISRVSSRGSKVTMAYQGSGGSGLLQCEADDRGRLSACVAKPIEFEE